MILDLLWQDIRSRAPGSMQDTFLILDEYQHPDLIHNDAPLPSILQEGRRYGLSVILSTQTLSGLTATENALIQQAATKIHFRQTKKDAFAITKVLPDKKRREKYIPAEEVNSSRKQIELRKALEKELKALQKQLPKKFVSAASAHTFATNIRTGEALRTFSASVRRYRKRECFRQLHDYIYGEQQDKVFILYSVRDQRPDAGRHCPAGNQAGESLKAGICPAIFRG